MMAENIKHAGEPVDTTPRMAAESGEPFLSRDESLVFEQWLRVHMSKLFQEVLREPLPNELNEIVERFEALRCPQNNNCKPDTIESATSRCS